MFVSVVLVNRRRVVIVFFDALMQVPACMCSQHTVHVPCIAQVTLQFIHYTLYE